MHIFIYFVCGGTSWIVIHNRSSSYFCTSIIFDPYHYPDSVIWCVAAGRRKRLPSEGHTGHTGTLWGTHCNTLQHCAREEHWVGAHCNTLLGTPTNTTSDQSMLIHTNTRNTRTNKFAENTEHKNVHKQKIHKNTQRHTQTETSIQTQWSSLNEPFTHFQINSGLRKSPFSSQSTRSA